MAKGQQQMQCCKEGCDGAGKEATANKAAQDNAANGAAKSLPTNDGSGFTPKPTQPMPPVQPLDLPKPTTDPRVLSTWNFHSKPNASEFHCSRAPARAKFIFDLFRPTKVEAAAGCNDAMMAMAQGAMQMLSALAGMAAGMMGGNNAKKSGQNASNLGQSYAQAPQINAVGETGLGNAGTGNSSGIQVDPALLRDGKGAAIASDFEKNFGIPADVFANKLLNGTDPRAMLMNAPKNALSADAMNQAFAAAKNMSAEQKAAAMAGLADLQNQFANKVADAAGEVAGGGKSASRSPASTSALDDLDLLNQEKEVKGSGNLNDSQLSPELQAALAARESEEIRAGSTIFQVVHKKYQEKMRMIYGFDAHGHSVSAKGVANADGF